MSKKINLRDQVQDGEIDLSMSDLQEVPVRDIAALKRVTSLDLSNNRLTHLGKNFATLTFLIKLDLSKNQLTKLPDNFGDLVLLKHLDLYSNQLNHLPLSFGLLKNLKWLDLKNNPLVPALAEVAGPCSDERQCLECAKKVVKVIGDAKARLDEEHKSLIRAQLEKEMAEKVATKKEQQKNRKRNEKKKNIENGLRNTNEHGDDRSHRNTTKKERNTQRGGNKAPVKKPSGSLCGKLFKYIFYLVFASLFALYTLYVVDINRFRSLQQGAGEIWNMTVSSLPKPVVESSQQVVSYVGPSAKLAYNKLYTFVNDTSTFLNTDPRIKDYWANVRSTHTFVIDKLTHLFRTVYTNVPIIFNDLKDRLI